jgi:ribonuclease BN (tRNA processing enzyme)
MSGLRLTVLGCSGTYPGADRMCSSYLLEADGFSLLLDCGNGSLSNLQRCCDVASLDAIVISHLHPDHFADLYGLYYALRFHHLGLQSVPVYAPADAWRFVSQLLSSQEYFADVCRFTNAQAGQSLELGPFTVSLFGAEHPVETLASRVEADGKVFAYSADSAPTPELTTCASGADLFACDATWLSADGPFPGGVHMTAAQAGRQAADAEVRRLLVTHVYPTYDPGKVAGEAARAYNGPILPARDLAEIEL